MSVWSRLAADLYILYRALFAHPLRRLTDSGPVGEAKFLQNYAGEGLVPTLPEDKALLSAAGRCIACGLCDQLDGQLGKLSRGIYGGASLVPLQYSRSSVEVRHAQAAIEALDPEAYRPGEAVCPTRVPLVALAAWLKVRLARTLAPAAGAGGPS